jgi:hypothetical protein
MAPGEKQLGHNCFMWEYKGPISFTPGNFPEWLMFKATFYPNTGDSVWIVNEECKPGDFCMYDRMAVCVIKSTNKHWVDRYNET